SRRLLRSPADRVVRIRPVCRRGTGFHCIHRGKGAAQRRLRAPDSTVLASAAGCRYHAASLPPSGRLLALSSSLSRSLLSLRLALAVLLLALAGNAVAVEMHPA